MVEFLDGILDGMQQASMSYNNNWFRLALLILGIIGMWKMFGEFGEKKWKSIIPIYNWYILFKNIWSAGAFVVYMVADIGTQLCFYIIGLKKMSDEIVIVLGIVMIVMFIIRFIYMLRLVLRLNKAYEYQTFVGVLAAIGGIFVNSLIVIIIYAFGKNSFKGNKAEN